MIRFSRLAGIALAVAVIIGLLMLINGGLLLGVDSLTPLMENGETPTDIAYLDVAGNRIAGCIEELRRTPEPHRPVGLILGQSTAELLDVEYLSDLHPDGPHWTNINCKGGTINRIRMLSDIAAGGNLPITDVVLTINAYQLAGTDQSAYDALMARSDPNRIYKKHIWFTTNRSVANDLFRKQCYRWRVAVLHAFGLGYESVFVPNPRPWENVYRQLPDKRAYQTTRFEKSVRDEEFNYLGIYGWYDSDHYRMENSNVQSLRYLLNYWTGRGCRVMLVLLPDDTFMRSQIPPIALGIISTLIAEQQGRVTFLNLYATVPDDQFADLMHTMTPASKEITLRIAEALERQRK